MFDEIMPPIDKIDIEHSEKNDSIDIQSITSCSENLSMEVLKDNLRDIESLTLNKSFLFNWVSTMKAEV